MSFILEPPGARRERWERGVLRSHLVVCLGLGASRAKLSLSLPCLWVASCLEKITLKNCTELKLELRVTLWKINIGSETGREGGRKGRGRGAHQNFSFIFPSFLLSPSGDSVTFL